MKKDIETTYGINKWKNKLVVFMQNDITHHVSRIKLSKNNLPANASAILLLIRIYYIAVETEKVTTKKKNRLFIAVLAGLLHTSTVLQTHSISNQDRIRDSQLPHFKSKMCAIHFSSKVSWCCPVLLSSLNCNVHLFWNGLRTFYFKMG